MRRVLTSMVVLVLLGAVLVAAADARRGPTRGERAAIAKTVKRTHPDAPARCYPLRIAVSTVNKKWASADFQQIVSCRSFVGNGTFVLRRIRRGAWALMSEGSEHMCHEAPRGVIRDLLGQCL